MQVLILGNGNHTKKRILPALKSIRSIENIVIADKNTENKEKIDSKLEIRNFSKELKNNEEYNLIIIATPPYNHKNSLLDVVNKSNNILVEKPISNDINFIFGSEFKDLKNKFNIFESLMYFHHPLWSKVKDIIKENKIIKIFSEFSVPHLQDNNYVYNKKLGGGSLFDQGIYPVSLALEISNNVNKIEKISVIKPKDYEVDLGGTIELILDEDIEYFGKWGLGKQYKNYLLLESNDGTIFHIDFIFSKPDDLISKINLSNNNTISEIEIGKFDQFQNMYEDIINGDLDRFEYSNFANLLVRYNLIQEIIYSID